MNRKNQITKDFALLLNDSRLQLANIIQDGTTTRFDVLFKLARKAGSSYYIALDMVASVTLENNYSNIVQSAADVLSRHPYRKDAPLMRLRVNTLGEKRTVTLGVTYASNLEFFGMRNEKASDQLADALLDSIDSDLLEYVGDAYYSALVSSSRYHVTHTLRLNLDE